MSALAPRATGLAAAFVSFVAALLPLTAHAQQAATVKWGSYLGGTQFDRISVVVKSDVYAYAIGTTTSPSLNDSVPGQSRPNADIFVARFDLDDGALNTNGFPLLIFGGNGGDEATAAVVGPGNALYIVGKTTSTVAGGITPAPVTSVNPPPVAQRGGTSAFLAKVRFDGALDWFKFLDGSADDAATGIDSLASGDHIYVTGWTRSTNFMGASGTASGANGFVTKIQVRTAAPSVDWGTLPTLSGGEMDELFNGIAMAGTRKLYVAGTTYSTSFPYDPLKIVGQPRNGTPDAIAAKLDVESGSMDWVTWVGGPGADYGAGVAVGENEESIVVAGHTTSPNLGTGTPMTHSDAFAAWLYPSGLPKHSEVLRGSLSEEVLAITTDSNHNAYIGGRTASGSFPRLADAGFDTSIETGTALREGFVWASPREGGDGWVSLVGGNGVDEVTSLSFLTGLDLIVGLQTASDAGVPGTPDGGLAYDGTLSTPPDGFLLRADVKSISGPFTAGGGAYVRRQPDNVREDDPTTTSTTALYANWDAFSMAMNVARYDWAIGTEDDYTLARTWAPVGLSTSAAATNLDLQVGTRYFVTVRAMNSFGMTTIVRSGGILVTNPDGTVPPPPDAGTPDAGTPDAGTPDAGTPDAGTPDGSTDGGTPDPGDGGGNPGKKPQSPVGFGCASSGGGLPLLVLLSLFALALLSRRLGDR